MFPPAEHCSDNAVMIAWAGMERFQLGIRDSPNVVFQPRWPVGPKVAQLDSHIDPTTLKSFNTFWSDQPLFLLVSCLHLTFAQVKSSTQEAERTSGCQTFELSQRIINLCVLLLEGGSTAHPLLFL